MDNKNWVKVDRRYNQPYRLTAHARFTVAKWVVIVFISATVLALGNWLADIALLSSFGYYGFIRAKRHRTNLTEPYYPPVIDGEIIEDELEPVGERYSRHIPNDVKAEAMRRAGGKCQKCGAERDLHYDHIWPYSKGGTNTIRNIQVLCGDCNRRKSDKIM